METDVMIPLAFPSRQQHRYNGKVDRHGQVFQNQHRNNERCFRLVQTLELSQHLGDDSRGGNVGDSAQEHRSQGTPAQEESRNEPWRKVQHQVHPAGGQHCVQMMLELLPGVLQPKHKQKQQHADLGSDVDEIRTPIERREAAIPERQAQEQVKRNG